MTVVSINQIHNYWLHPDVVNMPHEYLKFPGSSQFLVDEVKEFINHQDLIFEAGCNVGRNLDCFRRNGFERLVGADINDKAIRLMREFYPSLNPICIIGKLEDTLPLVAQNAFDVVYTMAVLEHIHPQSEFIFDHLIRITKRILVTLEDERGVSWRHFPRNYSTVFGEKMSQIKATECVNVEGLHDGFRLRVFLK